MVIEISNHFDIEEYVVTTSFFVNCFSYVSLFFVIIRQIAYLRKVIY